MLGVLLACWRSLCQHCWVGVAGHLPAAPAPPVHQNQWTHWPQWLPGSASRWRVVALQLQQPGPESRDHCATRVFTPNLPSSWLGARMAVALWAPGTGQGTSTGRTFQFAKASQPQAHVIGGWENGAALLEAA